jgi:Gpi18-like mannosyltransferase
LTNSAFTIIPESGFCKEEGRMLKGLYRKYGFVLAAYCLAAGLFLACRAPALHQENSHPTPWDSGWYANIWVHGYAYDRDASRQQNIVFSPLYPSLCYITNKVFHFDYPHNTMLVVSLGLSLLSVIFLFKLLYPLYGDVVAARATTLFVLNPFAIYLFNGYSEAAWALCIIMLFYFLITKNNPYFAALCVALGSTSRANGIILLAILIFHLLYRYLQKNGLKVDLSAREVRAAAISIPLSFVGLAIYTTYSREHFGNPLPFQQAIAAWGVTSPFRVSLSAFFTLKYVFYNLVHPYWGNFPHPHVPVFLAHPFWIAAAFFLATPVLLIAYRKRMPATLIFFTIFFMAFYYVLAYDAPWLMINMGRHLMVCFPFALALALACDGRGKAEALSASMLNVEKNLPLTTNFINIVTWRFGLILIAFAVLFAKYTYEYYCFRWIS